MSPNRTAGKSGHYEIRLTLKGIGEVRRTSGTSSLREYRNRVALIRKLHKNEQYQLLRAWQSKRIAIEELIEWDRTDRLASAEADVVLGVNLWDAIERTLPKMGTAPVTRRRYAVSLRALQVKAAKRLGSRATVEQLATIDWKAIAGAWDRSPSDWMNLRTAISAFVTTFLDGDTYHPFARKVRRLIPSKSIQKRRPSLSAAEFRALLEHVPAHAAASYRALVVTGMRVGEYLRCDASNLVPAICRINVPGTKTEGSRAPIDIDPRLWPVVVAGIPSRLAYAWLREHFMRAAVATGKGTFTYEDTPDRPEKPIRHYVGLHLHDLRHVTAQWATDAGIAESKIQRFLRHDNPAQTRDYAMRDETLEVSAALADTLLQTPEHGAKRRA